MITSQDVQKAIDILKGKKAVVALLAPTVELFISNNEEKFEKILQQMGFLSWISITNEINALVEDDILEWKTREKHNKIMISSSCPVIVNLIETEYPELIEFLSKSGSPMHLASKRIKEKQDVSTIFIGPCVFKKMESMKKEDDSKMVDVVLTFEEFQRLAESMNLEVTFKQNENILEDGCKRIEIPGGLAYFVQKRMKEMDINPCPVFYYCAGLKECKKVLQDIKVSKYINAYIELMACENGCCTVKK